MGVTITAYGAPDVGSQGLVTFDQTGSQISNVPYTNGSDALQSILARRSSDGHIFLFGTHVLNYEFDANLSFVQTFSINRPFSGGFGSTSDPRAMQFVAGFCFCSWFDQTHGVSVQKCDPSSLAVLTTWTFANPGAGANPYAYGVTTDGTKAFYGSAGGPSSEANKIWIRDLVGGTTTLLVTKGTYVSGTGYNLWAIGPRSNGDFVAYWMHTNAGNSDGADLVTCYDASGVQLWETANASNNEVPPMGSLTLTNDDTVWVCSHGHDVHPFEGWIRSWSMSSGALLTSGTTTLDVDTNGTGAGGIAVTETVSHSVSNNSSAAPQTNCTPNVPNSGGRGNAGCNTGGFGWTSSFTGDLGTVPDHADPPVGETFRGKRGVEVWIELIHTNQLGSKTTYRRAMIPLGHSPTFEGGRKTPGLVDVGAIEHSLGNGQGGYAPSDVTIVMTDAYDDLIRTLRAKAEIEGDELYVKAATDALGGIPA